MRSFFRPSLLAPALTPSIPQNKTTDIPLKLDNCLHGGSVTIASKSSPHRQGFRVTSNVHRSIILEATLYCVAAQMTPGGFPVERAVRITSQKKIRPGVTVPLPLIWRPSMSEPKIWAPKYAVGLWKWFKRQRRDEGDGYLGWHMLYCQFPWMDHIWTCLGQPTRTKKEMLRQRKRTNRMATH